MMELVIGGSGSGKSAYAEERICCLHRLSNQKQAVDSSLYYIADMLPYGKETEKKIKAHRNMREGKGFVTLEWYSDLEGKLSDGKTQLQTGSCALLECVSNLTANEMYSPGGAKAAGKDTAVSVEKGIRMLKDRCRHLVVVTNDVFRESAPVSEEMTEYKKNLGRINRALAKMADRVTEVICGIPVCIKQNETTAEENAEERLKKNRGDGTGMKFVTGGAYQGKLKFAREKFPSIQWTDGAVCPLEAVASCEGMDHFHIFVKRWLQEGKTRQELVHTILDKNRNGIFVCDETGCGLVPVDAFEREYREMTGRISTELAGYADEVYRVVCGEAVRLR